MADEIAKTAEIKIRVELDAQNFTKKIEWAASDMHPAGTFDECKAMAIALFDKNQLDTLRIDLYTDEMQVNEMDRFVFQTLRSLADTYLRATKNTSLANDMARFAQYFGEKTEVVPKS